MTFFLLGCLLACIASEFRPKKDDWVTAEVCASCEHHLTDGEQWGSHGVCPHCGVSSGYETMLTRRVVGRTVRRRWFGKITFELAPEQGPSS